MVAEQEAPPTTDQLVLLRTAFLELVKERGRELFEESDVARYQSDHSYVQKFWVHGFFIPGPDRIHNTTVFAVDALIWRKEFGVKDITEDKLDRGLMDSGSLYARGTDAQGGRVLIFSVRRYVKDAKMMMRRKQIFVYLLERIERETGGKITIVFDCQGAGVRNVEIEAIQFIMQVLIHGYPNLVRRIVVLEMPWVMNTVWRLVKSLLPGPAQDMIKFCSKANISEYIEPSGLPRELGGEDDWQYRWEPEQRREVTPEEEGGLEERGWTVSPPERLVFRPKGDTGELEAALFVASRSESTIAFKVRSTRPGVFLVSPHSGLLPPGARVEVRVRALVAGQARLERERFQVVCLTGVPDGQVVKAVFEEKSRVGEECVLGCEVERVRRTSTMESAGVEQANKQARVLSRKLGEMEDRMGQLRLMLFAQCCLLLLGLLYFTINRFGRSPS